VLSLQQFPNRKINVQLAPMTLKASLHNNASKHLIDFGMQLEMIDNRHDHPTPSHEHIAGMITHRSYIPVATDLKTQFSGL
jgi:hypothetical protein